MFFLANRIIKANSLYFYMVFSAISLFILVFCIGIKIWIDLVGNIAYLFALIPVISLYLEYKKRKSATIILKNGFIILDSKREILEISDTVKIYEKKEYKRDKLYNSKQVHYYLCFEKNKGEIFKLPFLNYSKEDMDYLYKYIMYYGSNVERLDYKN